MIKDNDVKNVLSKDGVENVDVSNFQNLTDINIKEIKNKYGPNKSWAVRTTFNDIFGAVLIQQLPGEGNRVHMHPDANECWYIVSGEWEWFIEGIGNKAVSAGSVVNVEKNTFHKITCKGSEPGIRFAITKPDVDHIYK